MGAPQLPSFPLLVGYTRLGPRWMPLVWASTIYERDASHLERHQCGIGKPVSLAFQRSINDILDVSRSKMVVYEVKVTLNV